jgi:hypothetical protein
MKVMKKTNGYSIEVSHDEYDDILDAVDAGAIWHDENGNNKQADKCRALYEKMEKLVDTELANDVEPSLF